MRNNQLFIFCSTKNEGELCSKFAQVISQSLNIHFSDGSGMFINIFTSLMELGKYRKFNLIIDEFQEFSTLMNLFSAKCKMFGIDTRIAHT